MRSTDNAYHRSLIYQEFKEIDQAEFRQIVRFFETRHDAIQELPFNEYLELLLIYADALFEIGTYHSYISVSEQAIAITIEHNIKYFHGEYIFYNILFKKAAAHYNLLEYDKAEHILNELIKMNPEDEDAIRFLKKCKRQKRPEFLKSTRAISVFMFLLTAAVIGIELFIIRPFFSAYIPLIEWIRNFVFATGWGILLGGDLYHRWKTNREANVLVHQAEMKKEEKKIAA